MLLVGTLFTKLSSTPNKLLYHNVIASDHYGSEAFVLVGGAFYV